MNLPTSEPLPPESELKAAGSQSAPRKQPASKRPAQETRVENLQRQMSAGFDFYLAAALCALLLGIALTSDAPILYFLALLVSPFLGPVIGGLLVIFGGSTAFLINTLGALAFVGMVTLGIGGLAGWLQAMITPGVQPGLVGFFGRWGGLEWVVTALGSALITFLLARAPRQRPLVVNLVLAYSLLLPLGVAGYGWGAQKLDLFFIGIRTAGLHLLTVWLISWSTLLLLRWRPRVWGYGLGPLLLLGIIMVSNVGRATPVEVNQKAQTTIPLVTITPQPTLAFLSSPLGTQTPTLSTPTPRASLSPLLTPSATVTPEPTPVWAKVAAQVGGGAFVRETPDGRVVTSLLNDTLVQVISDPAPGEGGVLWVKVRTPQGVEGWIMQSLLATATPMPAW